MLFRSLLEEFVQLQLLPYERLFGPDRPHFALDQVRSTDFMICPLPLFFNNFTGLQLTFSSLNSRSVSFSFFLHSSFSPSSVPAISLFMSHFFHPLFLSPSLSLSSFLSVSLFFSPYFSFFLSLSSFK